jgi:hypothetical protein
VPTYAWSDNIVEREKTEQLQTWEYMNFKIVADNKTIEDYNYSFNSFDVSENGDLLIGIYSMTQEKVLYVEQETGNVIEYSVDTDGSFYVNFNGNNIQVFFVKGDFIVEFTKECELVTIYDAPGDTKSSKNKTMENGDKYYSTNKSKFASNNVRFSQLVKESATGEKVVVYDGTKGAVASNIVITIIVLIIFTAPLFIIFNPTGKKKRL